jgi:hypothetical protein
MSDDKEWQRICDSYAAENQRFSDRIEKLEAALQFYVCGCNVRCADFKKNSRCGYTARKALEGKDD